MTLRQFGKDILVGALVPSSIAWAYRRHTVEQRRIQHMRGEVPTLTEKVKEGTITAGIGMMDLAIYSTYALPLYHMSDRPLQSIVGGVIATGVGRAMLYVTYAHEASSLVRRQQRIKEN